MAIEIAIKTYGRQDFGNVKVYYKKYKVFALCDICYTFVDI